MYFSRHGIPEILITDNGPQFTSNATKGFLNLYIMFMFITSVLTILKVMVKLKIEIEKL